MTRQQTSFYFALAAINIIAGIAEVSWLSYLTKPLLMLTLGVFYFQKTRQDLRLTDKLMLVALLFSCLGDTFLMFQEQNPNFFLFGLGSFFIAQLAYTYVFEKGGKAQYLKRIPFVVYATILFEHFLQPKIPKNLLLPIIVYTFAITWMGVQAMQRQTNQQSYRFVLFGAITFIISDSLIALNKFVVAIPLAGVWIMLTYVVAQYLIVEGILKGKNG